jgi:hypothetical protein
MTKIRSWVFVAALALGGTSSAMAQSTCPATVPANKITISGVTLTDGASYEIYFGSKPVGGAVGALVKRNGTCLGVKSVSKDGTVLGSALPTGINNVCFGSGVDVVTLMSAPMNFSTCAGSPTLNAFNHNGNTITLYGAGGADRFYGGPGTEIFWGGTGTDLLAGTSGISDELYGENDADQINGGTGTTTWIDGGSGADTIQDSVGFFDTIIGGSGNDFIDASCSDFVSIDCGSNTDTVWHETHGGGEPFGWGCETVNHATWC